MSFSISRITSQALTAHQVSMANAAEIVQLLAQLGTQGIASTVDLVPSPAGGLPDYQITLIQPGYIDQIANIEDWIVVGGDHIVIWPNLIFLTQFTSNAPLTWGATTTAPVASALSGLTATLVFPQPTSPNAPWTYSVSQTNVTTNVTSTVTPTGAPVIDSHGNVTLTVGNLTATDKYTFTVSVSTQYTGVTALTSVVSNTITATT